MSRVLKVLAAVLVVLAIAATVIHYKREFIAREIANSALRERGLVATDLSIDTLGTERILLSQLVLVSDDGTRYELRDVSFPLNFPSAHGNTIAIGELLLVPAKEPGEPTAISAILQTFLALPDNLPDTELSLSRISRQGSPPLVNVAWRTATDSQRLSFDIDAITVTATFERESDALQRAEVRAMSRDSSESLSLQLSIRRLQDGYAIDGPAAIQLAPWLSLLHILGVVPAEVVGLEAGLAGSISAELPDASDRPATVTGELTIDGPLAASYLLAVDSLLQVRGKGQDLVSFELRYPSLDWTTAITQSQLVVSTAGFTDVPVSLAQLRCRSGVICDMHVSGNESAIAIGDTRIGNLAFAGTLEVLSAEEARVTFAPDFKLLLENIESPAATVASLGISFVSGAALHVDDENWRAEAETLDILIDGAAYHDSLLATLPVSVTSLRIDDRAQRLESHNAIAAGSASIRWKDIGIVAPGAAGKLSLDDGVARTTIELSDSAGALSAQVDVRYEMAAGRGSVALRDANLSFDRQPLSAKLLDWPYPWDLVSGSWNANGVFEFASEGDDWVYEGSLTQGVRSLAGHYNDIVFTGLDVDLSANISAETGIEVSPSSLTLALLDVGIPIEQLAAAFVLDVQGETLDVSGLSMTTLGGKITADPFRYAPQHENNEIMLWPQSIQLQFMVDLAEFEDIALSGSISGVIPVTVSGKTITVSGGRLESDPPGGVIRYGSGLAAGVVADDSIGLVSRALGNFQFDSLSSDVDYTAAGDLKLQMRLSGINPDMDPTQPVILNLGVENNVPQLLRSLQATRAIEDLLQRKSNE
ncbi:MAG: YdbH domain-containing protein [Woeseiaceae bacterium]|nr:YdbH domain-containing protein [Woeseiaceae bacterium]